MNEPSAWAIRSTAAMVGVVAVTLLTAACGLLEPNKKPGVPEAEAALDHLLCYFAADNQFTGPQGISLKGQWDREPRPVTVASRQLLCNPVAKGNKLQRRLKSHLVCYDIGTKEVKKTALADNKLDPNKKQTLNVTNERYLCLPSGKEISSDEEDISKKDPPPIPRDIDHFKCCQVERAQRIGRKYQLTDQFNAYDPVQGFEAVLLCNPVEKFRDGRSQGKVLRDFAHLLMGIVTVTPGTDGGGTCEGF